MTLTRIFVAGLLAAALSVISILAALPAHAQDAVYIKGQELPGFARIRFEWPEPVEVVSQETNGVIVLKFARPFKASLNDLPSDLPNYVALARQDADGRTLRLALKFPFRLETLTAANEVYVNLVPDAWQSAELPGLPEEVVAREKAAQEAAARAAAARKALALLELPDVPVRVGVHESYSRIVFEWPEDVNYKVTRDGELLELEFDSPGHMKVGRLRVDPPPFVVAAKADTNTQSATLRLMISPEAEFRMFREPTGIVLDLTAASEDAGALAAFALSQNPYSGVAPADAAGKAQKRDRVDPMPEVADNAAAGQPNAQPGAQNGGQAGAVTMIDPRRIGRPDPARITKDAGYAEGPRETAPDRGQSGGTAPASAGSAQDNVVAGRQVRPDVTAPDVPTDSIEVETPRIVKPAGQASEGARVAEVAAPEAAAGNSGAADAPAPKTPAAESYPEAADVAERRAEDQPGSVKVRRRGEIVTFTIAGLGAAPAAVFERDGFVWALLDTETDVAQPELTEEHQRYVQDAEALTFDNGLRGLRLRLTGNALVTAQSEDDDWLVSVGETVLQPPGPLPVQRGVREDGGGRLFVIAPDAGPTFRIQDPLVGDELALVPLPAPVRGVVSPRQTVDLEVLPSAHGLVFRPIADDVEIGFNGEGQVTASRRSGLVLTANPRRPAKAELGRQNNIFAPGIVGFRLASGDPDDFHAGVATLNKEISDAQTPEERKIARLALARFYLGYEYASEALGVMALMVQDDEEQDYDPEFIMLRGIANHMLHRDDLALEDLSRPVLAYDPNASVWRVMARARNGKFVDARPDLNRARTVISDYGPSIQARFHLAAAQVSLGVNDIPTVEGDLRKVPDKGVDPELASERTLLMGQLAKVKGNRDEALSLFEQTIDMDYRPVAARAILAKAAVLREMGGEAGEGALDEVVNTLDRLRFTWRGGDVELEAASELARIYEAKGDYRAALDVMRSAATEFPGTEKGRQISDDMMDLFRRLFLDGEVDSLPPLEALSLFYDFRELTPVGADGDRMIRALADRLVAVELLDQAAEMLDHQVTHRLRGVARAQVAGRLAAVHLLNSAPAEALAALRKTRQAQLPRSIADERLLLEAKALSALERHDHALELLSENKSDPAQALMADVLWDAGRYAEAGTAMEDRLGLRWTRDDPLTDDEQFDVLRAAISYVLASDDAGIERMRQKYASKMQEGPQAASFSIVASSSDGRGIAFRDLAREIAQVDSLERFMRGYRERYDAAQAGEEAIN
ncbi:hypothetical protein [Pyruvatibacter mobilis]|uniref:hypothetical protein n=1 Tax=Pyruvatibacter mobilis TaxID=1712261 RepID=UPI003BAC68D3